MVMEDAPRRADMKEVNRIGWDILLGMVGAIPTVLIVITIGGRWVASKALAPVEEKPGGLTHHRGEPESASPRPARDDEIAHLIAILNTTFDRLQRASNSPCAFRRKRRTI